MTPQTRLTLWYLAVIALVLAQHIWFEISTQFRGVGLVVVTLLLLFVTLLLLTTPPNAFRLKPRRSVVILSLLSTALFLHASFRFFSGSHARLIVGFVLLTAIFFTQAAVRKGRSSWWVVPLWWNPLMVGPFTLPNIAVMALAGVMLAGMIVLPRKAELTA